MSINARKNPLPLIAKAMADAVDLHLMLRSGHTAALSLWDVYNDGWPYTVVIAVKSDGPQGHAMRLAYHSEGGDDGCLSFPLQFVDRRIYGGSIAREQINKSRLISGLKPPAEFILHCGPVCKIEEPGGYFSMIEPGLLPAATAGTFPFRPYTGMPAAIQVEQKRPKRDR